MPDRTEWISVAPDGRRLALTRAGSGGPPIIFETGLGAESNEWEPIFHVVGRWTTVCRYDRANRGASDPAPRPRTVADLATDLHALLTRAAVPRPVVLVGHSLGGLIARLYAYQYPDDVAGLVLADPMHEDQFERTGPLFFPPAEGEPAFRTQMRRFWTEDWRDPAKNVEGVDFPTSQAQLRAIESLGAIPMLILTAGAYVRDAPTDPVGQQYAEQLQAQWRAMHRELAAQSSTSVQISVESSGHFVQRDRPDVIVDAIRQILAIVRNGTIPKRADRL